MYLRLLYLVYRIYLFLARPVRMGTRVMMVKDGQVFLVRQSYRKGWFLPGGGLKRHESIEQAMRREAREETGAELGEVQFMGIYTSFEDYKTDHNILFACRDFRFIGRPDDEIAEARFFSLEKLPETLMEGHRRKVEAYLQGRVMPTHSVW